MDYESRDKLAIALGLSPRQVRAITDNKDKYDLSRLAVRNGALYIPYKTHGLFGALCRMVFGARVDVIGRDD